MFKLELEPLAPRLLQNREIHMDYLKFTQEQADILQGIVEQAKAKQPLDKELDFACKHAQRIQELLVYVQDTCPNAIKLNEKKVAVTPKNKVKKVRFAKPLTSSSNIKHVESSKISDSNTPVLSSTGLKYSTNYPIWEVIQNGNGPVSITTDTQCQIKVMSPRTAEEILARERERKARTTLLMALPENHLAKFHKMADAKEMWEAIKSRFGGNDESKKMQKYILKQQFEGFFVSNSEGLHKGYDRFQILLSQLEIHRAENDVKRASTASSSSTQNVAFVFENTSSTNDVSIAYGVSNPSSLNSQYEQTSSYSLLANQSSCPQLDHEDLEQLDEFDLEEIDLKWQVAMISMRMKKFYKKTGRKLQFDAKELVGFDKTKVECYNCHKTRHFARECRTKGNQDNRRRDAWNSRNKEGRRSDKQEDSKALVTIDGEGSGIEREQVSDASIEIKAYTQGLKKVEAQLVAHQQGQLSCEDEHVVSINRNRQHPSFANQQVKTHRETVKNQFTHSKNPTVDKKGLGYGFITKAFFICGSLSHLIRDCDFHEKRMAKQAELNNRTTVLTRTCKIPVNTARASGTNNVSTARHNFNSQAVLTNAARKISTVKPVVNRVNTAEVNAVCAVGGKRETAVKPSAGYNWRPKGHYWHKISKYNSGSRPRNYATIKDPLGRLKPKQAWDYPHRALQNKGIFDSGCSRHMTGNKAYLAEYQDFNGDPVAFGGKLRHFNLFSMSQICDKKNKVLFTDSECLVLSPEFKLPDANQVLLRIPRQNNMYSFNLENIVPSGGLACLIAKATIDESNKWHRRLGHVNFKNLNKFVKGNLVRGLPSKIFQNDHTCVACQKGKQHKTSCKAKSVSSISHSLQLLHMDLFGPTSRFYEFVGQKGIKREYNNARTPQQNGVVKRKNKTLIEAARTMLADSFLPNTIWAEAVSTACYVLNCRDSKHDIILVQVYVDDIIFGSTKKSWCDEFEALMKSRFQMSSMGELTFFLGLQVKQKEDGIFISQDKYVAEILKKFDFVSVKTASTPIETQKPLVKDEEASDVDVHLYRSMIGSLMYLTASRPDIMFAVCACSRFQVTPKTSHLSAVKRIFRYLKGKPKLGLWYPRVSSFDLEAYSDSDYAGANLDRKSTTGGCQFLGRRLISWQCKKQTIMATSTTEAEYVAAANCCGQVLWIQNQMLDYGFNFMNTKIYIDNESTICIVKNPVYHSKTKHIAIRHHFIRDAYEKKLIQVLKIHTDDNVADLLTKAFDVSRFQFLVVTIGMINP
ncbi:putative ribonuclease H-like domain-containing protein [Tanacetum coccineum]